MGCRDNLVLPLVVSSTTLLTGPWRALTLLRKDGDFDAFERVSWKRRQSIRSVFWAIA